MVEIISDIDKASSFARPFIGDQAFCDPNNEDAGQFHDNLLRHISKQQAFGVYDEGILIGLFAFLALPEERYVEMLMGLSCQQKAYEQMIDYLSRSYPGCQCFFVHNPRNVILKGLLRQRKARFDTEQMKMDLKDDLDVAPAGNVVAYSEGYEVGYKAIHIDEDRYWTADKVLARPERFRVLLALADDEVVGYIDVSIGDAVNEPYELFVRPECRRHGYGRALLAAAIAANRPYGMSLHVDVDNIAAINLYSGTGFTADPWGSCVTAQMKL